ncbi:MAG TPA: hypothetical protein VMD30_06630, partial [Tepidisphaeraceae bacterium]|nr:hypothetical protein [Tepidisphaeraceae bacterium]
FGFKSIPYGIPTQYLGTKQKFEVVAASHYSGGRGRMLRFRDGMRAGRRHKSAADTAVTVFSALALHPHFTHAAMFAVRLPDQVPSEAVGESRQTILWSLPISPAVSM